MNYVYAICSTRYTASHIDIFLFPIPRLSKSPIELNIIIHND